MADITIAKRGFKCLRCGHQWLPRKADKPRADGRPHRCAKCKSLLWESPKTSGR